MSRQLRITNTLTVSAIALAFSISAQAGASRTFVANTGSDSNTATNCGATTPCRTFTAALSVTNSGGEIVVLSSGGYGPATVTKPVIIVAIGVDASISVTTSGANGMTINTSGNVTLVGLNLHGEATGESGIGVSQVGTLRLYNMLIENFTLNGVDFEVSGKLAIYGSTINDNAGSGVTVANASAAAYVQDTSFDGNSNGVEINSGQATVVDSAVLNNNDGFVAFGGALTLFSDRAMFNSVGLHSFSGSKLYFADCFIANNTFSYDIGTGSTMAGTSPGTSFIGPNQNTAGTLGTPIALQ